LLKEAPQLQQHCSEMTEAAAVTTQHQALYSTSSNAVRAVHKKVQMPAASMATHA
jgi:hypothetical protein